MAQCILDYTKAEEIDWFSDDSYLMVGPHVDLSAGLKSSFDQHCPPAHVCLFTSGSSGEPRIVALSKKAWRSSAEAVNAHLEISSSDSWVVAVPAFHAGGLSIFARASLSRSQVRSLARWKPSAFLKELEQNERSVSALVPTQVYDLVTEQHTAPASLRAVIVGGAALSRELYLRGRDLGWPLLPSYGLTETASQIATAPLTSLEGDRKSDPPLQLLSHANVSIQDGLLVLSASSLLTGYINEIGLHDPKEKGWFLTRDTGSIHEEDGKQFLRVSGRADRMIKVKGELVSLDRIEEKLRNALGEGDLRNCCALAVSDARDGMRSVVVFAPAKSSERQYFQDVARKTLNALEYPLKIVLEKELPQLPNGKLDYRRIQDLVSVSSAEI